jgi:hypothetical protein
MSGAFAVTMVVVTFVSLMIAPLSLDAQSPEQSHEKPGPRASFTAGASLGDGETALALSTGLGFRFSARLGLEFELAYARKLDFTLDLCLSTAVCVRGGGGYPSPAEPCRSSRTSSLTSFPGRAGSARTPRRASALDMCGSATSIRRSPPTSSRPSSSPDRT